MMPSVTVKEACILVLSIHAVLMAGRVSSDTVILNDHSRFHQSWDWLTTYQLATGSGWSRSSQTGEYVVCDLPETATKSTNSWLISNFINLRSVILVKVNVEFTVRQCDFQLLPFCKQSFYLHYYQTDSMIAAGVPKAAILAGHFTLIGEIKAQRVWSSGHTRIINNATVQFSVQRGGLYLGFQDIGGCIALGKVRVSYNFCPAQTIAGVSYARTSSPSAGGALRVYGKCGVNSESPHNATSIYMKCLSNGSWSSPNYGMTCFCKPGYQSTSQGCQVCPVGTYKTTLGNSVCSACPKNTNWNNSRQQCSCNTGYYRGPNDNKQGECTAPPSAPRNASIIFQDQSVIVVAWMPPFYNGDRQDVVYDITCLQCDPTGNCHNRELCRGRLQYWPMKENNPFTHVTLTGLQPNTSYLIKITAENGVSYLYGTNMNRTAEIEFGTRISAKMVLVKTYVDDTTAVLTWRTVDHPHEYPTNERYEIACFKCEEGGDSVQHRCTETCGDNIRYWPGKEGLKGNHVTVSELRPSTLYEFVLYVWNSHAILASVIVETSKAPTVKEKSDWEKQFVSSLTIIAMAISSTVFIIALVVFVVSFYLRQRWRKTALDNAIVMQ